MHQAVPPVSHTVVQSPQRHDMNVLHDLYGKITNSIQKEEVRMANANVLSSCNLYFFQH